LKNKKVCDTIYNGGERCFAFPIDEKSNSKYKKGEKP
jgi:hypothetical protein